ncbi:MAG: squalene/phytoene synthase family protein [Chloroflexota bacterium]
MLQNWQPSQTLAARITKAASQQSYYTIRFLADRERVPDAFRAYAYFRWLDDRLDQGALTRYERMAFVNRQQTLVDRCYQGERPRDLTIEETMLVDLIGSDQGKNSGLQAYIRNMMAVMAFDAGRRGRLISQQELDNYSRWLAVAVTEALHYFIGHGRYSPHSEARYHAVMGAHIAHILRDTLEDADAGYFNVPREFFHQHGITPRDVQSEPYRAWVQSRVQLARRHFRSGKDYLTQVESPRCRLAGYAYIARFEWVLDAIEREGYRLRLAYDDRKNLWTGLKMSGSALALTLNPRHQEQPA